MAKLPAFQFYPGDWLKDPNLRRCSPAARGVWIDMLCLMFECDPRGVLATGGNAWGDDEIASVISGQTAEVLSCIQELLTKEVASRNGAGAIFSRRMVRDEQIRRERAKAGAKGGSKPKAKPKANSQQSCEEEDEDSSLPSSPGESEGGPPRRHPADGFAVGRHFERFRMLYPKGRLGGRDAARTAFIDAAERGAGFWRCTDLEAAERLCVLAEEYAASPLVASRARKHVLHATSWLEKGTWKDPDEWLDGEGAAADPNAKAKARLKAMVEGAKQ